MLSLSADVHSYPSNMSNIPHTNMVCDPLSLDTLPQLHPQFHQGNALQPLGALVAESQTIHPFPAWSTSLVPNSLGPPRSQERIDEPGHLSLSHTSSGPPPAAATTNLLREPFDESESQATNLSLR